MSELVERGLLLVVSAGLLMILVRMKALKKHPNSTNSAYVKFTRFGLHDWLWIEALWQWPYFCYRFHDFVDANCKTSDQKRLITLTLIISVLDHFN